MTSGSAVDVRGQRLASGAERAHQELDALLFRPVGVRAEPASARDRIERLGVARGFLTDVEPDQRETEGGQPAAARRAAARRRRSPFPVACERSIAEPQRLGELGRAYVRVGRSGLVGVRPRGTRRATRASRAGGAGHRAAARDTARGAAGAGAQLLGRVRERQLAAQLVDLAQVERRGHPARDQACAARDVGGHGRIAVAIAANPRAEPDRRHVERQAAACDATERSIERSQELRHGVHRICSKTPAPRAPRRAATAARAAPPRSPTPPESRAAALDERVALERRQIRAIEPGERLGDAAVLVLQRPAHDLGRMRGQHELDPQRADRLVQRVARHAGRGQPRERSSTDPGCGAADGSRR